MKGDRQVAGLWCHEVLELLYDHLDGELGSEERAGVEAHLAECSVCARFGGEASALAAAIRAQLSVSDPISGALERKLLSASENDPPEDA